MAESTTVGGHEAVRLEDHSTTFAFVIRAGALIYEISPAGAFSSALPRTWLDDIARTFSTIERQAIPSASPTFAPQAGQRETAEALAAAFAARDADAVARLMPECWLSVVYAIDGTVPGQGGLNRSVFLFTKGLRDRFAARDLTVVVDPTLHDEPDFGPGSYFVRSEWREPDRTVRVDLGLELRNGRWIWNFARHQYTSADLRCIPYRSPWISGTSSC